MPDNSKLFMQNLGFRSQAKRYNKNEQHLFQTLYYRDPGYYKFFRETLEASLPSKNTILKWRPLKILQTGLIRVVMAYLQHIHQSLTEEDRKVILCFDEMDGRRGLFYEEKQDRIIGFEFLTGKSNKLAKKILTLMIRGVNGKLGNIIIANYATTSGISGSELPLLIPYIIRALRDIKYEVIATTCDQSAVNRKAFSILKATPDEPYFFVDDYKVWALFDIPHLFKSARISFLERKMTSKNGNISGDLVKKAFYLHKDLATNCFSKLSNVHFEYDTFEKMRVDLAVQILSESVASSLEHLKNDQNTIKFVRTMNVLFDIMNAKTVNDSNENKRGVSASNIERLIEIYEYLGSIEVHIF
uniref:CSON010607 protein n=1 Tax=Culicoides sonorensis TaxID=179676 RepID=A0A336N440_CULSO